MRRAKFLLIILQYRKTVTNVSLLIILASYHLRDSNQYPGHPYIKEYKGSIEEDDELSESSSEFNSEEQEMATRNMVQHQNTKKEFTLNASKDSP